MTVPMVRDPGVNAGLSSRKRRIGDLIIFPTSEGKIILFQNKATLLIKIEGIDDLKRQISQTKKIT